MISEKISKNLKGSSMIRAMFEEGTKLKKEYGEENVFDFSLGNPENEPPKAVRDAIIKYAEQENAGNHKYMPNAGYADVRTSIAAYVSKESGINFTSNHIMMTCGAAGGLNALLKALLDPNDEVVVLAPFFVEYLSYIDNHGGKGVIVPPNPPTFQPDVNEIEKHITSGTKAVILNSPNNPTGAVYKREKLEELAKLLARKEKEYGNVIYVISDEPYTRLIYDGIEIPSIPEIFKNAVIVNSYSKSHALAGERIGYVAASPRIEGIEELMDAAIYCNRVLGYVNAPSMFQKVVADTHHESVDVEEYRKKRDRLYSVLTGFGFECAKPEGTFYLFIKCPDGDDFAFKNAALKQNILLVPGSGFGCKGYVRLAYCTSMDVIERSIPAFGRLARQLMIKK